MAVAIHRLLQRSAFDPEAFTGMTAAYEAALAALDLPDKTGPVAEIVAKRIIEVAQTGERDPARICELAIKGIGVP